jgi:transcriptional regulator with XRE-family HTH domain
MRNTTDRMGLDMSDTSLGKELRKARGERGLRSVAAESGISIATLSRIESDLIELPGRETLAALSAVYGLPMNYLAQLAYCGSPQKDSTSVTPPRQLATA